MPVVLLDGSFKPIEQAKRGDLVLSRDANRFGPRLSETRQVTQTSVRNNVQTLSLTFANGETIETTSEHPFYVQGEGFVPAGRLAIGNAIVTRAGPPSPVVEVVWNGVPKTVYNFTVEGDHTYFVGNHDGGLWVHNINCAEEEAVIKDGLDHLNGGTRPSYGRKWGDAFQNRENLLPRVRADGSPITYTEHYLPKAPNDPTRWGARRLVAGSDGSIHYTGDHYGTFRRIR